MSQSNRTARRSVGGRAPPRAPYRRPLRYYIYGKRPSEKENGSKSSSVISDIRPSIPSEAESGSAAQRTVLSTPDLLIIILSQLPHSALLQVQRVNRTWAGLFDNLEIQASLFRQPRPKGSALYVEAHSDILMDHFSAFWPSDGQDGAKFDRCADFANFHSKSFHEKHVATSDSGDSSDEARLQDTAIPELSPEPQDESNEGCPHREKWSQLLVCQPPIKALELVQRVSHRVYGMVEFRTVIHRPDGLRMGFLFDAVWHWHEVEGSNADLLWNRQTGDTEYPEDCIEEYEDGPVSKVAEGEPCLTIWGHSSFGCGQSGGLTYSNYRGYTRRAGEKKVKSQIIYSDEEEVKYSMYEVEERPTRIRWPPGLAEDDLFM